MSKKDKRVSNAIFLKDEIVEHLGDKENHHLYKKNNGTVTANMCCDWEVVDADEIILKGECGSGISLNLVTKQLSKVA